VALETRVSELQQRVDQLESRIRQIESRVSSQALRVSSKNGKTKLLRLNDSGDALEVDDA